MTKILILITLIIFLTSCTKITKLPDSTPALQNQVNTNTVPLPNGGDITRTFFALIAEKRIPEAIEMMSTKAVPDEASKQAWGVQFNAIESVEVTSVEPWTREEWSNGQEAYKVTLNMQMSPDSADAPISYYGWENGVNTRWVYLQQNEKGIYKVTGIATGP